MPIPVFATLSVAGGFGLFAAQRHGQGSQPLVAQLTPKSARQVDRGDRTDDTRLNIDRHLALSWGLVGSAALGGLGLPVMPLVSLSGLIYLSGYFIYRGAQQWQRTHRVTLETNDAVLATGLLLTGHIGAGALFATLYFTGRKLEEAGDAALDHFADEDALFATTPANTSKQWRGWIDQSALPLLTLSVVSTPFLGFGRAVSVLVANFAYDYRVFVPLGTIRFLRTAQAHDIHIRNAHVFDLLQQTDVLVIDGAALMTWRARCCACGRSGCALGRAGSGGDRRCRGTGGRARGRLLSPPSSGGGEGRRRFGHRMPAGRCVHGRRPCRCAAQSCGGPLHPECGSGSGGGEGWVWRSPPASST
ncbi:MAG: hypothetical protein R2854_11200 [Caldilineaceae bacterium]